MVWRRQLLSMNKIPYPKWCFDCGEKLVSLAVHGAVVLDDYLY